MIQISLMDTATTTYNILFRKYYPGLLFYATRFLPESEAEDIVQDTFLELWKRKDSIEIGDQIQAFLYRITYTKCFNAIKHKQVENEYSATAIEFYLKKIEFYDPAQNETIQRMENRELQVEVYNAINELPDKCREIFKLSYLHDLKNKEIAETLDISLRTVEAHMYKALKYLRVRLKYLLFLLFLLLLK